MNYLIWIAIGVLLFIGLHIFNKWNRKPVDWNPKDVADLLQSWIDENVDYQSWDYFEACEISNPKLEVIRQEALDVTYIKSPLIISCGNSGERLNEQGKDKFKELREKCLKLV